MSLSVDKVLRKAQSLMKAGELAEAEELYKQVIFKFPKNKKAIQGYQKLKAGITSKVSSKSEPTHEQVQELIDLYNYGQFEKILKKVKPLIVVFPKAAVLHNVQGVSNAALQIFDAAIESYKKAIIIKPDYDEAYNNMGNALKDNAQLDAAINSYKKAIKINPDYADAYRNMGTALQDKGELDAAIDSYKQAIKIKPDYADAYSNMGTVLMEQGHQDAAIEFYNKALIINPGFADAHYNMGIVLQDKGELDAALNSYNQALKIQPDHAEAHNGLGIVLKDKGELNAAIASFKQAITIKPNYNEAIHVLASLTGETTNSAPREYVEKLFDAYASKFENALVEKLEYQAPKIITEMIIKRHPNKALGSVLDLGCGTGIAGLELKQFCQNLEGIDLSNSMLEQARTKDVYDKLIHGDIVEHLTEAELDFDYFISTDVFIYVGELSDVFRLIQSRNNRQGKLVFSTEHTEGKDFYLEKSGRYSHSKNYIDCLCFKYGYQLVHFEKIKLRKEKSGFLIGGLYLLEFDPTE